MFSNFVHNINKYSRIFKKCARFQNRLLFIKFVQKFKTNTLKKKNFQKMFMFSKYVINNFKYSSHFPKMFRNFKKMSPFSNFIHRFKRCSYFRKMFGNFKKIHGFLRNQKSKIVFALFGKCSNFSNTIWFFFKLHFQIDVRISSESVWICRCSSFLHFRTVHLSLTLVNLAGLANGLH